MMYKLGKIISTLLIVLFIWALWYSNTNGCSNTSVTGGIFSSCKLNPKGR